jgi:hypothetical protein
MGNFHKVILMIAPALIAASIATSAAATKTDEALALCRARGPDCHALKVSADGSTTVILCVNNSSTGNGVQCVQCPSGQDCSVARIVPVTRRGVGGVLNNDMRARRNTVR